MLYKWNIVDSPRCSYCFVEVESLTHIFCECPTSVTFYYQIKEWCKQWNVDIPEMDIVKVLYGITNNQTDRKVINHLLLVYKTMIFQCRKNVNLLTMKNYKLNIGRIVTVERSIAINCNTLQNYEGKWKSYINFKKLE